jgi:hypothetical protein
MLAEPEPNPLRADAPAAAEVASATTISAITAPDPIVLDALIPIPCPIAGRAVATLRRHGGGP